MTTPQSMSRALAELARECEEMKKQCEEMNKMTEVLAMTLSGPNIYPAYTPYSHSIRRIHCDHCKHHNGFPALTCAEYNCPCLADHAEGCSCHGDFQRWCDAREIQDWLNGLTNSETPAILARVLGEGISPY